MTHNFELFLRGKKSSVDNILDFISKSAEQGGHDTYSEIKAFGMINLPDGYDSMATEKEVNVEIGGETREGMDEEDFYSLAKIAPDVYMSGNDRNIDYNLIWNYESQPGDDTVELYFTHECLNCGKIIGDDDLENAISVYDGEDLVCSQECLWEFYNDSDMCPNCEEELDESCFVDDNGHRFCSEKCCNEFAVNLKNR